MMAERDELTAKLAEATALAKHYEKCCDSYADENQKFHDRFTAAEEAFTAAEAKLASLRQINDGLEQTADDLHKQIVAANARLAEAQRERIVAEEQYLQGMQEEIQHAKNMREDRDEANAEIARLKAENDWYRALNEREWSDAPRPLPPPPQETTK